jgi:hypothetical protein
MIARLIVVDIKDGELAFLICGASCAMMLGTDRHLSSIPMGLHGFPNTKINPFFR